MPDTRPTLAIHEHAFQDQRPFAQCHASTLISLPNGKFLLAFFAGTHESHSDVGIWGVERTNGHWSAPRLLVKARDDAHWNPVLHADHTGRVWLFFKVGTTIEKWETWVVSSEDEGQTWSEPRELVPGDRGGRGPVKNKILALTDGTWLAGASLESGGVWDVFVDRSNDQGQTWQATSHLPLDRQVFTGRGVIQPTLWQSAPKNIHLLVRSTCGRVGRSDSTDGGHNWSAIYPTDLPHNNSGLDIARLQNGALALVCNPVEKGRTPLSVLLSYDNGQTWTHRLDLETNEGEYSYPAIIATEAGMAISYTWQRERVTFWMGSPEQVPAWK